MVFSDVQVVFVKFGEFNDTYSAYPLSDVSQVLEELYRVRAVRSTGLIEAISKSCPNFGSRFRVWAFRVGYLIARSYLIVLAHIP